MKIKFDLNESKIDGIKYYGKLILTAGDDEITIDITVRKGDDELYVCYPSKKSTKDNKYYNQQTAAGQFGHGCGQRPR